TASSAGAPTFSAIVVSSFIVIVPAILIGGGEISSTIYIGRGGGVIRGWGFHNQSLRR
ncbi:hypothetical protein A2U01_0117722, partial [Trifolium medium]|nr:hypothetical protein [Trifolium medium]